MTTYRIRHDPQRTVRIIEFPARDIRTRLVARLADILRLFALWHRRARERQALAEMDDRQLRDIGITRADARRECEKPFWR